MIKVNGKDMKWNEGMTILDIIKSLDYAEWYHPILIVSLNGKHIPYKEFDETSVEDSNVITIFKSLAGG